MLKLQPNEGGCPSVSPRARVHRGRAVRSTARSRGAALAPCHDFGGLHHVNRRPGRAPLLATSFAAVSSDDSARPRKPPRLGRTAGATLYIRGDAECGARYGFAPPIQASFTVGRAAEAASIDSLITR